MSADRFGIVNDPDDEDTAVLLYDGEPIGTIRRSHEGELWTGGLRFVVAGLHVKGEDLLDRSARDASIGWTPAARITPEVYAAWKRGLGLDPPLDAEGS